MLRVQSSFIDRGGVVRYVSIAALRPSDWMAERVRSSCFILSCSRFISPLLGLALAAITLAEEAGTPIPEASCGAKVLLIKFFDTCSYVDQ